MGRFAYVVDTPEGIKSFKARYHIPPGVSIRYCHRGEWHALRQEGEVVIPIIAFIEGGTRIPMGRVTRATSSLIDSPLPNVLLTCLGF